MEFLKSYLAAQNVAECLIIAHHSEDEKRAKHADYADREFRLLAERMGYRVEKEAKVEPASSPLSMETAAALLGYPGASR